VEVLRSTANRQRTQVDDPQQTGDEAELIFDNGASVSATALFASQKSLAP